MHAVFKLKKLDEREIGGIIHSGREGDVY